MATRTVSVSLVANIGSFVSSMTRAGAAATGFGSIAGKALGAAGLAAGFASAVSASADFEQKMSGVQAATMASAGTMGQLRKAAMEAGADTAFSAGEAADAIKEMAKAGVSTADIMGGGLKGALSLAAAGQMGVADAAGIASTAMVQFNLAGEDLPHVADLLAAGAGKAMGEVSDLGAALNQAGLVASAAGLSIEETTGTLSAFASAGLVGSDAGTSLKSMLQRLQNPSEEAAGTMAELGVSMYDASGQFVGMEALAGQLKEGMQGMTPAARDAAMAVIFGSDAVRAANVLYKNGATGIGDWIGKVNDAGYAAEQAAMLQDNLKGDLEKLGGAWDTLMISLGEGSQGPLRMIVQGLTGIIDVIGPVMGAIGDLVGWFTDLPGPVLAGVGVLTTLMLLNGPLAGAVTTSAMALAGFYGRAVTAATGAGIAATAMGGLRTAAAGAMTMMGGPLGLAITGAVVGLGFLASAFSDTGDETVDAETAAQGYADALKEANGAIDDNVRASAAKAAEDSGLLATADDMGIALGDVTDAITQQGEALDTVRERIKQYITDNTTVMQTENGPVTMLNDEAQAAQKALEALELLAGKGPKTEESQGRIAAAVGATGAAMDASKLQTDEATKALDRWIEKLQTIGESFVEPLDTYKTMLGEKNDAERAAAEETAASTDSATDSWEDYVTDVDVSLDELATRLEDQLLAQDNWRANIATITQRGGLEVGQILAAMGEEGVQLAAKMANGTDAEFDRMAALLIEDAKRGGAGAAAALDTEMKVMAEVGATGAGKTATAIAEKLGIGVAEVQRIAAGYGITLVEGVNPVLAALGKPRVKPAINGAKGYYYADGGFTGHGGKYEPAGIVHKGEYVLTKDQTARLGINQIEEFANRGYANGGLVGLPGYANGGMVRAEDGTMVPASFYDRTAGPSLGTLLASADRRIALGQALTADQIAARNGTWKGDQTNNYAAQTGGFAPKKPPSTAPYKAPISTAGDAAMEKMYTETIGWLDKQAAIAQAGTAGGGAIGGGWGSLWTLVKAAIPAARINSTFRAGDPGYHGRNKAIDFGFGSGPGGAGSAGLASINRFLHDRVGGNLAELIYDGIGDDRPDLKNGRPLTYNAGTRAQHRNHVHAAVYHQGTDFVPRTGFAYLEKGEAVIPASLNPRSREFSGGGRGGGGGVSVAAPVVHVTLDGRELRHVARVEAAGVVSTRDAQLARNMRSSL